MTPIKEPYAEAVEWAKHIQTKLEDEYNLGMNIECTEMFHLDRIDFKVYGNTKIDNKPKLFTVQLRCGNGRLNGHFDLGDELKVKLHVIELREVWDAICAQFQLVEDPSTLSARSRHIGYSAQHVFYQSK